MPCYKCRSLQMDEDIVWHQKECEDYDPAEDADELRLKLNGVEIGMWADTVLTIHPKSEMVQDPVVVKRPEEMGVPNYTVKWIYPGFELTFQRAVREHQLYGVLSVYAVQRIEKNDKQRSDSGTGRKTSKHHTNLKNRRSKSNR